MPNLESITAQILQRYELAKTTAKTVKKAAVKKVVAKKTVSKKTNLKTAKEKFSQTSTTTTIPKNYDAYIAIDKAISVTDVEKRTAKIPVGVKFGFRPVYVNDKRYYILKVHGSKEIFHLTLKAYEDIVYEYEDEPGSENVVRYTNQPIEEIQQKRREEKDKHEAYEAERKIETPINIFDVQSGKSLQNNNLHKDSKIYLEAFRDFGREFSASNKTVAQNREQRQCLKAYKSEGHRQINEYLRYGDKGKNGKAKNPLPTQNLDGVLNSDSFIDHTAIKTPNQFNSRQGYKEYLNSNRASYTVAEAVDHIDKAFDHFTLPQQTTVGRVIDADENLHKQLQVGNIMQDKGFVSTTMSKDALVDFAGDATYGSKFPVIMNIKLPKGSKAIPIDTANWPPPNDKSGVSTGECELLLPRNQNYKITAVRKTRLDYSSSSAEVTVVEMELVP